jgi:putative two-component system response regulator
MQQSRTDALGLTELISRIRSENPEERRKAYAALVERARSRLNLSEPRDRTDWFDTVSSIVLQDFMAPVDGQIELLLKCAEYYHSSGMAPLGLATASHAASLAESSGNWPLLRRAYGMQGTLYGATRDRAKETICFAQALELAYRINDPVGICATLANVAKARYNAGQLTDSIEKGLDALALCGDNPVLLPTRIQAHHNIALAALALSDKATAIEHIDCCISLMREPQTSVDAYLKVIAEFTYTKVLIVNGRFEDARKRASIAKKYAAMSSGSPAAILASMAEAWCEAYEKQFDVAMSRLAAIEQATRHNDSMMRDVLEAQMVALTLAGHVKEAKERKRAYLAHLGKWQARIAEAELSAVRKSYHKTAGPVVDGEVSVLNDEIRDRLRVAEESNEGDYLDRLETIAVLAELRDDTTGEHSYRVGCLVRMLAQCLGFTPNEASEFDSAARLHDIGKIIVPDVVLQKRASLDDVELEVMRRHTTEGAKILRSMDVPGLDLAVVIAESHHEKWDGSGYPNGLAGEQIPIAARMTAIADAYDTLTHRRPYKPAWSFESSVKQIEASAGRAFDTRMVSAFCSMLRELRQEHGERLDEFLAAASRKSTLIKANRVIDETAGRSRTPHP